jgi:hypothetical protein
MTQAGASPNSCVPSDRGAGYDPGHGQGCQHFSCSVQQACFQLTLLRSARGSFLPLSAPVLATVCTAATLTTGCWLHASLHLAMPRLVQWLNASHAALRCTAGSLPRARGVVTYAAVNAWGLFCSRVSVRGVRALLLKAMPCDADRPPPSCSVPSGPILNLASWPMLLLAASMQVRLFSCQQFVQSS